MGMFTTYAIAKARAILADADKKKQEKAADSGVAKTAAATEIVQESAETETVSKVSEASSDDTEVKTEKKRATKKALRDE